MGEQSNYLTHEEMKESYPALLTLVGPSLSIRRVTAPAGLSAAHMVFAPEIERALKIKLQEGLWSAFRITVKLRRKKSGKRKAPKDRAP
jgi:hypothetical protein